MKAKLVYRSKLKASNIDDGSMSRIRKIVSGYMKYVSSRYNHHASYRVYFEIEEVFYDDGWGSEPYYKLAVGGCIFI